MGIVFTMSDRKKPDGNPELRRMLRQRLTEVLTEQGSRTPCTKSQRADLTLGCTTARIEGAEGAGERPFAR